MCDGAELSRASCSSCVLLMVWCEHSNTRRTNKIKILKKPTKQCEICKTTVIIIICSEAICWIFVKFNFRLLDGIFTLVHTKNHTHKHLYVYRYKHTKFVQFIHRRLGTQHYHIRLYRNRCGEYTNKRKFYNFLNLACHLSGEK